MADVTLISGSMFGNAGYVAEHLAEKLDDAGFSSEILHRSMLEEVPTDGIWLIISSTHDAGDIPDNLQPLYDVLREQKPDLSQVHFSTIGIGSREYDTFCGAIDKLEAELKVCGAKQIGETLRINVLEHGIPEDPAEIWLGSQHPLLRDLQGSYFFMWITPVKSLDQPVVTPRTTVIQFLSCV